MEPQRSGNHLPRFESYSYTPVVLGAWVWREPRTRTHHSEPVNRERDSSPSLLLPCGDASPVATFFCRHVRENSLCDIRAVSMLLGKQANPRDPSQIAPD